MAMAVPQHSENLKLETRKISQEWTIEDYLANQPYLGEKVNSETFDDGSLPKWHIQLEPRGSAARRSKFGVFLTLNKAETDKSAVVDFTLMCLNDDHTVLQTVSKGSKFRFNEGIGSGYVLLKRSNVPIPLSQAGKLIVRVDITLRGEVTRDLYNTLYEIPKSTLSQDLLKLLKSGDVAPATIETADGQMIPVHKGILAARSDVLAGMFNSGMKEAGDNRVKLPFEREIVASMLEYLYSDEVINIAPMAARLYPAAHQYQLGRLVTICSASLSGNLSVDNFVASLRIAKLFGDDKLQSACQRFLDGHKGVATQLICAAAYSDD